MILDGYEAPIKEILEADATLMALLTGGIFENRELGVSGNSFQNIIASRRDPTIGNIFKPFSIVRGRNVVTTSQFLRDEPTQYTSVEQTVEVWILDDPSSSIDVIDSATDLVYELLQFRPPTGAFQCELVHYFDARDYDFAGARAMSLEFLITGQISPV
jgi:hypothetical protein